MSMLGCNERYAFEVEWYDKISTTLKKFYLFFYPADNSVELFDLKTRKTFLKRSQCEGIVAKDFMIGRMITIFSRNMKIVDYANAMTKNKFLPCSERTFVMIKPEAIDRMGEILKKIISHNFHIGNLKLAPLAEADAQYLYKSVSGTLKTSLVNHILSGPVLLLELLGENVVERVKELAGPDDSVEARKVAPTSLRACYGKDSLENAIYIEEDQEAIQDVLGLFFPSAKDKLAPKNTATFTKCTCCVIKPHAVQAGLTGAIIEDIKNAGFTISAIQQFVLDPVNAEEFLEIYKGVLPEYSAMVAELQSGACVAMEITHQDDSIDVPNEFRKLVGPMDPEIARQVRKNTLRAKYGKTKVQNALHCSDLPEDGLLEVEYFFKILAND